VRTPPSKDLRQKELDTLLEFSALINSSLNIEQVLDCAMQRAEEFIMADASTVYELDDEKGEVFIRVARGKKRDLVKKIRLKLGEGIAGHVVKTGHPMVIQDVHKEPRFSDEFDRRTGFKTRSMICVPLLIRGEPIGALQVLNKSDGEVFLPSDLELLTSMSQQIAVALENAKLYRRLEERFDLTSQELKAAQERLIRSERLLAVGHLVQGVAHEIRNPVTTIGGFAQRLKKELNGTPKLHHYIDIILEESGRLERLVEEIREFLGIVSPTLVPDDLPRVLSSVLKEVEPSAQKQGVTVTTEIDKKLPPILMDANQLSKAFLNIIENALDSMPQGGRLFASAKQDGSHIVVSFRDTGRGISEKDLSAVYDPFFTSKPLGAGLGLTMAYQIVMNHDGAIHIQSKEGVGTTVTVHLHIRQ
jgi:signal transduction histidine kinase